MALSSSLVLPFCLGTPHSSVSPSQGVGGRGEGYRPEADPSF